MPGYEHGMCSGNIGSVSNLLWQKKEETINKQTKNKWAAFDYFYDNSYIVHYIIM